MEKCFEVTWTCVLYDSTLSRSADISTINCFGRSALASCGVLHPDTKPRLQKGTQLLQELSFKHVLPISRLIFGVALCMDMTLILVEHSRESDIDEDHR